METVKEFDDIIGGIVAFGDFVQKKGEASNLLFDIHKLKNECGSCYWWMKSNDCPRESRSHKVSCGERICDKFKMCTHSADMISKKENRYKEIIESLK